MNWLSDQSVLFWIRGKPGSGKSTLMRYLHDNKDLRDSLMHRNLTRKQISLWFFFNDRGTYLEKSLDGLLRSILFQLREQESELFDAIFEARDFPSNQSATSWDIERLTFMFRALMLQQIKDIDLILFLDALDEYHGFPETIAKWIADLAFALPSPQARSTIKMCVSCRPWEIFIKTFSSCPGFILHEYTTEDIEQYTISRLSRINDTLSDLNKQTITGLISKRAEGVFLWVKLAVDELLMTSDRLSLNELEQSIAKMPDELESFYTRTIQRLPQHNRSRAYMLLEIMYRIPKLDLSISIGPAEIYNVLACARGNTYQDCRDFSARSEQEFKHATDDKIQELLELSGGLLEIQISCGENEPTKRLQFIHKTARDFVGTSGFAQTILQERCLIQSENGYTSLFKRVIVIYVRTRLGLSLDEDPVSSYAAMYRYHNLVLLAHMDEKTTGRPLTTFINSISAAFWQQLASSPCFDFLPRVLNLRMVSSFTFAVSANLQLYVRSDLSAIDPQHVTSESVVRGPLIDSATLAVRFAHWDPPLLPSVEGLNLSKMIELLLDHGFHDTRRDDGLNAFGLCFWLEKAFPDDETGFEFVRIAHTLITIGKQDPNEFYNLSSSPHDIKVSHYTGAAIHVSGPDMTRMLLQNGADPNLLDENENTAMDITIKALSSRNLADTGISPDKAWIKEDLTEQLTAKLDILLAYGGTVTRASARVLIRKKGRLKCFLDDATMEILLRLKPLQDTSESRRNLIRGSIARNAWNKLTRNFK